MFCIYCGKELEDGSAFCKYCGKRLNSEPQQEQAVPQPASWQPAPPPEQPAYVQPPVYNPPPLPKKPGQTSGIVALAVALAMLAGSVLFTLSRFEVVDWFDGDGESESDPREDEPEDETEAEAEPEEEDGDFSIGGLLPGFGAPEAEFVPSGEPVDVDEITSKAWESEPDKEDVIHAIHFTGAGSFDWYIYEGAADEDNLLSRTQGMYTLTGNEMDLSGFRAIDGDSASYNMIMTADLSGDTLTLVDEDGNVIVLHTA